MIKYILVFSLAVFWFSCQKKDILTLSESSENTPVLKSSEALPLSVGNYWIYQKSEDDTLGSLNLINSFDSVFVAKDTFIYGQKYFKVSHTNRDFFYYYHFPHNTSSVYIRDSSGYSVVYQLGLLLDRVNLHDTLEKSIASNYSYCCIVPDDFNQKQFLAGYFSGISMNSICVKNYPQFSRIDTTCSQMFVEGIGIVKSVYSFSACYKYCRSSQNLLRYHCN